MRRDEVSVKLGVSACLERDRFELVELPENIKEKIDFSYVPLFLDPN